MKVTLQNLYKGCSTTIKGRTFFSAKQYVEPFISAISPYVNIHICEAKIADQLEGNGTNAIYNKVLVVGVFKNDYSFTIKDTTFHRVICMNYSLDTRKPMCKFYTGVIDSDFNFYAFGNDCMNIQTIEPESAIDYSYINAVINNGLKDNCQAMLEQLSNVYIPKTTNMLGQWVDCAIKKEYYNEAGKVKLSTSLPIEVYKALVLDQDSAFYEDVQQLSLLNILKPFSNYICTDEKDIINRYEKIQLVNKLLGL